MTAGHEPVATGYPLLSSERITTEIGDSSVSVVALQWDGDLGGGIVLLDRHDTLLQAYPYPGARGLKAVGKSRFGFRYTASRGSNEIEQHFVVLCGLAYAVTVQCFDSVIERRDVIQGVGTVTQVAGISVAGDTIVANRYLTALREGTAVARKVPLGVVRWVLPTMPLFQ